ncbi:hypothetical protein AB2B41_07485 [Marimonas sp. MJW-29]|uniref:HdeA/HdeB family protein n=1 Tax=Sulfitobacter sediminis TaxID=3234186 RepID=A0ABV3RKL2_9RHOB
MVRAEILAVAVVAMFAGPGGAQSMDKATDCGYQAEVVAAVQQARKDRVGERQVQQHVAEKATWPENYNNAIPLIAGWLYGSDVSMRDIRNEDFAAAWKELCLQQ